MGNFLVHNLKERLVNCEDNLINLAKNFKIKKLTSIKGLSFLTANLESEPLLGERIYENQNWSIGFAGDLLDFSQVPYERIISILDSKNYKELKNFNGVFSFVALNKRNKKFYVVSDRRAQLSVYYFIKNESFIFSTEFSVYCKLLVKPEFNFNWFIDYLYFNFPIQDITFLNDVFKLPPASLLIYDSELKSFTINSYSENFHEHDDLLTGYDALQYAKNVFVERSKANFNNGGEKIAIALTGGWDGRTNLAIAPNKNLITAYTYGQEGCEDILSAARTAEIMKIPHQRILFDDAFIKELPKYMMETIYLSSGEQGILRSTLLFVYSKLRELLPDHNLIISGIMMDTMFRGHIGMPVLTPPHVAEIFRSGNININKAQWGTVFNIDYAKFRQACE